MGVIICTGERIIGIYRDGDKSGSPPLTSRENELGRLSDRTESHEVLLRPRVSENLCFL